MRAASRLRLALDMSAVAEDLVRARLMREQPDADAAEIERQIVAWYAHRPGAECGDADGTPIAWPPAR